MRKVLASIMGILAGIARTPSVILGSFCVLSAVVLTILLLAMRQQLTTGNATVVIVWLVSFAVGMWLGSVDND